MSNLTLENACAGIAVFYIFPGLHWWLLIRLTRVLQALVFRQQHKFPPLLEAAYKEFLEVDANGIVAHPQKITGLAAKLCIREFQLAEMGLGPKGKEASPTMSE